MIFWSEKKARAAAFEVLDAYRQGRAAQVAARRLGAKFLVKASASMVYVTRSRPPESGVLGEAWAAGWHDAEVEEIEREKLEVRSQAGEPR